MNMPTEVVIQLATQELDYICNVLAERPFKEVNGLLAKIVNQANAGHKLAGSEPPPPPPPASRRRARPPASGPTGP